MKRICLALAVFGSLCSLGASGQDARTATVDLSPRWSVGQRWSYEVLKTREQRTPQGLAGTFSSTSTISIDVLEATERGFVLRYVVGSLELTTPTATGADAVAQEIARLVIDVPFEIEVSRETAIGGIRNFEELRPTLDAAVDRLYAAVAEAVVPGQEGMLDGLFDQVRESFTRDDTVLASRLSEVGLFLLPFGWSLEPATPHEQETFLPNPLGGRPIPARTVVELSGPISGGSAYTLDWTQEFAGEDARRALLESMQRLAEQLGRPAPGMDDVRGIGRRDAGTFVIDVSSGTLERVELVQRMENGGASRVDTTEFRRLP